MNYVVQSFNPDSTAWPERYGPYERKWVAESVARKQRKLGRLAYIVPVDKEVT